MITPHYESRFNDRSDESSESLVCRVAERVGNRRDTRRVNFRQIALGRDGSAGPSRRSDLEVDNYTVRSLKSSTVIYPYLDGRGLLGMNSMGYKRHVYICDFDGRGI